MNNFYQNLQKRLQKKVTEGWQSFLNDKRYENYKEFALYLEKIPEFQKYYRERVPHPPHAAAARLMGYPFMHELMRLGLYTTDWWPGDFYKSEEIENVDDKGVEWHARVFEVDLLYDKGRKKLCRLKFTCPHSHHGFEFKEPQTEIIKIYDESVEENLPELVEEINNNK